jgi:hypothetical protein
MFTGSKNSGKRLVMLKGRMVSPSQHPFLRKFIFTMCFLLNLSFRLPLIILIIFSLFSIYCYNHFVRNLMSVLKIEDMLKVLTLSLKKKISSKFLKVGVTHIWF